MFQKEKRFSDFAQFRRVMQRTVASVLQRDRKLALNAKAFLAAISEIFVTHLRAEKHEPQALVPAQEPNNIGEKVNGGERRDQTVWGRGKREFFAEVTQQLKAHFIYLTDADLKAVMRHLFRQWGKARKRP